MRMPTSAWRLVAIAAVLAAATLAVSCAASDPPPRSPLEEPSPGASPGTSVPLPTFPAATGTVRAGSPQDADEERITGAAIDAMAEWLGVPATDLLLESIERVDWPSSCLGVDVPNRACAQAITPGYNIRLGLASRPQPPYEVHASSTGQLAWMPHFDAERVVESVDVSTGIVTFEALPGSDEMGRTHRVMPGSLLDVPLRELQPGDTMHVAVTWPLPESEDVGLIVWLIPAS